MNAIDGIDMTHSSHWNQGFRRIAGALALLGALAAAPAMAQPAAATHSFGWKGEQFLLDGKPFVIRGGEMHFSRVPREHWRDRLRMMKAMGLNTVGTYLFWNLHEPRPGQFDFSGQNDIAEFVRIAQEEGLWVILRPGPYACAEWELGGFPAWLLKTPDLRIRTSDPRYVAAATRFLGEVGKRLAPLQVAHGGPILMVQVENEYGSFGADHGYMASIRDALRAAGFDGLLYTADGPTPQMLGGGTLPDVLPVVNFGGDPAGAFAELEKFRGRTPRMAGEYYPGWFDHWGEQHHTGQVDNILKDIGWMLERDVSFSLYMFHGGTTFGFMNGANYSDQENRPYQPDTSSYDYGAPLDEAGRPTPAYHALRKLIARHLKPGETLPEVPPSPPMIAIPRIGLTQSAALASLLAEPVRAVRPLAMEQLDQSYGFVWYRTRVPAAKATLEAGDVRDMALLYQDGKPLGAMDRRLGQRSIELDVDAGQLDLLVENMGRINYGRRLVDERKGLLGPVRFAGKPLLEWEMFRLPLDDLSRLSFADGWLEAPAFHRGTFRLRRLGDSYIDMRGWGRGHVWINGHHLGRYWRIGPQQTLLVPAQWLRRGDNEIVVLELEAAARGRSVQGLTDPVFDTP
ncbi:beta-galactosidase [Pseudoxanthomonas sangjuensis]